LIDLTGGTWRHSPRYTDPEGSTIAHYSENLLVEGAVTTKVLPLALNDKPGIWTLRATDLPSGGTATAQLQVDP
jgi:hypothetical protein